MKYKTLISFLCASFWLSTGYAQRFEKPADVIAGGGSDASDATMHLHATIGQSAVASVSAAADAIGQGFWYQANSADAVKIMHAGPADNYLLAQNYPNPFDAATTFNFSIQQAGRVTLKVYSVTGTLVKTLVNENLPLTRHLYRTVCGSGTSRGGVLLYACLRRHVIH